MSGHGTQPVPKTSQGGAGPTGGARPRRPPESAHKPPGTGASSIPSDGKSLISSKIRILLFQCITETKFIRVPYIHIYIALPFHIIDTIQGD